MTTFELTTKRTIDLPSSVCVDHIIANATFCDDDIGDYVEYRQSFGRDNEHEFRITVWCEGMGLCVRAGFDDEDFVTGDEFDPESHNVYDILDEICVILTEYIRKELGE